MGASNDRPHVKLFTDGACAGNPGPGGWAYILRHAGNGGEHVEYGGDHQTTNNRMELIAVIEGLSRLTKSSRVEIWSDSQYVLKGLDEWMDNWIARGWRKADRKPVLNRDLWEVLDRLRRTHDLTYHWIRGHNDHPENERCDALATKAIEEYRRR